MDTGWNPYLCHYNTCGSTRYPRAVTVNCYFQVGKSLLTFSTLKYYSPVSFKRHTYEVITFCVAQVTRGIDVGNKLNLVGGHLILRTSFAFSMDVVCGMEATALELKSGEGDNSLCLSLT